VKVDDNLQLEGGIQEAGKNIVTIDGEWVDRREEGRPRRERRREQGSQGTEGRGRIDMKACGVKAEEGKGASVVE